MHNYERAKRLINEIATGDFEGPQSEFLVSRAEVALGVKFPPSYRQFLLDFGCGDIEGLEIYGLVDDNFENAGIPNAVWLTLNLRSSINLNSAYIIIGDSGDGSYYAIDTSQPDADNECPVLLLSIDGKNSEGLADNFATYLLESVTSLYNF